MGILLAFFNIVLIFIFVAELYLGHHHTGTEKVLSQEESFGSFLVALQKEESFGSFSETEGDCQDFELTSLKGRQVPQSSPDQDDGDWQHPLALPLLCTPEQDECAAMWQVRHFIAPVLGYDLCTWGQEQEGRAMALHCLDYRGYHFESTKEAFQITQIWKNSEGSYTTWTSWQRTRQRQAGAFGSRNGPSLELQAALGHAINLCKCNLQIPKLRHNFRRWSPLCKAAISLCLLRRFARSSRRQPPPRSPPRACIRL